MTEKQPNRLIYENFLPLHDFSIIKKQLQSPSFYWRIVEARKVDLKRRYSPGSNAEDWRVYKDEGFGHDPFEWMLVHTYYHFNEGITTPVDGYWDMMYDTLLGTVKPECLLHLQANCDAAVKDKPLAQWFKDHDLGDNPECWTAVLWLNECNGYVEFLDNRCPVKAKENRLVIFRSNLWHRYIPATNLARNQYITLNFFKKELPEGGVKF